MLKFLKPFVAGAALLGGAVAPAFAADIYEPPIIETPPPIIYEDVSFGGWYIRGDIDYHFSKFRGGDYITYGCCGAPDPGVGTFDFGDLKGAFSVGAGVGYQVNRYFRTDLTADYWFKSKFEGQTSGTCGGVPCVSVDESAYSALLLLANAYAELGTYGRITPYVGAGIGGAHVKWDDLNNTIGGVTELHKGASSMRFAWALMAGASYCITSNLKADLGYRFSRISGGRMFEEFDPDGVSIGVGPGFDDGFDTHEVRAGLRYQFGGSDSGCGPQQIAYEQPEPYVPIYK